MSEREHPGRDAAPRSMPESAQDADKDKGSSEQDAVSEAASPNHGAAVTVAGAILFTVVLVAALAESCPKT